MFAFGPVIRLGLCRSAAVTLAWLSLLPPAWTQEPSQPPAAEPPVQRRRDVIGEVPDAPKQVEIEPAVRDEQIAQRLTRILRATEWYQQPEVTVDEGIVFLAGLAESPARRDWATALATSTQGVVAVVNRMEIAQRSLWDFAPAWNELRDLWRQFVLLLPYLALGLLVLVLSWFAARATTRAASLLLRRRLENDLVRHAAARLLSIPVFLLGLYLVLQIFGLGRLALTLLGGTGLAGLVLGIAFRDILENFLASILISRHQPFHAGDLIEVQGRVGFVQRVTTRGTLLMAFDGTYVQIPNTAIFKNVIRNLTANPRTRLDFPIAIDYDAPIAQAQQVALHILREHPAVLSEPAPMVLVDQLTETFVMLRIYYWVDSRPYSYLKVQSSIIRLVKGAFQEAGLRLPSSAQAVVFPRGVPLVTAGEEPPFAPAEAPPAQAEAPPARGEAFGGTSTPAEADLASEAPSLARQAQQSRVPELGEDLLPRDQSTPSKP